MPATGTKNGMKVGELRVAPYDDGRWEMLCTWSNEQAIREIYLKPFELCVKDNAARGGASVKKYSSTQWNAKRLPNCMDTV